MSESRRKHDAAAVELAAGWIAICASCGWVGESYGTEEQASVASSRHIAEAADEPEPALGFLADARHAAR
jgi:ApbE superfamily uncharacterized protein (UPF0280 family)